MQYDEGQHADGHVCVSRHSQQAWLGGSCLRLQGSLSAPAGCSLLPLFACDVPASDALLVTLVYRPRLPHARLGLRLAGAAGARCLLPTAWPGLDAALRLEWLRHSAPVAPDASVQERDWTVARFRVEPAMPLSDVSVLAYVDGGGSGGSAVPFDALLGFVAVTSAAAAGPPPPPAPLVAQVQPSAESALTAVPSPSPASLTAAARARRAPWRRAGAPCQALRPTTSGSTQSGTAARPRPRSAFRAFRSPRCRAHCTSQPSASTRNSARTAPWPSCRRQRARGSDPTNLQHGKLSVCAMGWMGSQDDPFNPTFGNPSARGTSYDFIIAPYGVMFPGLITTLIRRLCFFESGPYRVEPASIVPLLRREFAPVERRNEDS